MSRRLALLQALRAFPGVSRVYGWRRAFGAMRNVYGASRRARWHEGYGWKCPHLLYGDITDFMIAREHGHPSCICPFVG